MNFASCRNSACVSVAKRMSFTGALNLAKLTEATPSLIRQCKAHPPAIVFVISLLDKFFRNQFVGLARNKCSAEMQMSSDRVDTYTVITFKMTD